MEKKPPKKKDEENPSSFEGFLTDLTFGFDEAQDADTVASEKALQSTPPVGDPLSPLEDVPGSRGGGQGHSPWSPFDEDIAPGGGALAAKTSVSSLNASMFDPTAPEPPAFETPIPGPLNFDPTAPEPPAFEPSAPNSFAPLSLNEDSPLEDLGSGAPNPFGAPTGDMMAAPEPPGLSDPLKGDWGAPLEMGEPGAVFTTAGDEPETEVPDFEGGGLPLGDPSENLASPDSPSPLEGAGEDPFALEDAPPLELGDPFGNPPVSSAPEPEPKRSFGEGEATASGAEAYGSPLVVEDPFANAQFDFQKTSQTKGAPAPLGATSPPRGQDGPPDLPPERPLGAEEGLSLAGADNFPTLTLFHGDGQDPGALGAIGQDDKTQMMDLAREEGDTGGEGTVLGLMAPATSPPAAAFGAEDQAATILKEMAQAEVARTKKKSKKKKNAQNLPPPLAAKVATPKANRRLVALTGALVVASAFFVVSLHLEELGPFFKDQLVQFGIIRPPVPDVAVGAPKAEPVAPPPTDGAPQGAKAIRAATTQADGVIVAHFARAEDGLDAADVSLVGQILNSELPKPLTDAADLLLGASYAARYYMMVGNSKKAEALLSKGCQSPTDMNSQPCVHYLRALVIRGQHAQVAKYLGWLKEQGEESTWNQIFSREISLLGLASTALRQPRWVHVKALVDSLLAEPLLRSEWSRHRSAWLSQSVFALPKGDRQRFANYVHKEKRKEFESLFERTDTPWSNGNEPILMPFLYILAQEFELPSFGSKPIPVRLGSRSHTLGRILEAAGRSVLEPNDVALLGLDTLDRQDPNAIASQILAANLALMDGSLVKAHKLIDGLLAAPSKGPFMESILLLQVRYGLQTRYAPYLQRLINGPNKGLLRSLFDGSFEGAIAEVRVQRLLKAPVKGPLERAQQMALTPREWGLWAVEEAHTMKERGNLQKALRFLEKEAKKYPGHASLVTTYAEFTGLAGRDPSRAIEALEGKRGAPLPIEVAVRALDYAVLPDGTWRTMFREL